MQAPARSFKPSAASGPKGLLSNMQVLRFVAAAMVLVSHLDREARHDGLGASVAPVMDAIGMPWSCGVDLFFCISGFLMLYLTWEHFARPGYAGEFLKRRVIRIVPLYWIFTLAFTAVSLMAPSVLFHSDVTPIRLLASLGFIPIARTDGSIYPVLVAGWTLNYEAFFYTLFTVALFLPRRVALAALSLFFLALSLVHLLAPPDNPTFFFWSNPIILEFLFGMGAAVLYLKGVRLPAAVRFVLGAAGFLALILVNKAGLADTEVSLSPLPRSIWAGLPAVLILVAALYGPQLQPKSLLVRAVILGGDASYALYLCHMFATRSVTLLWRNLHLQSGWGFVAAGFVAALALAVLVYLTIEKPLLGILRSRFEPKRSTLPA
ncbi:MAG: acyltransferase [Caulobacteraceae bacterium]|nr:acyltransferase [Caulobacteraceae bacterium]